MGGGLISTKAKAAAFGAYHSALIDEAACSASQHQVVALSSSAPALESGLSVPFFSADKDQTEASSTAAVTHWPACEFDDREIAGGRDDEKFGSANPSPWQIFGPAPTLDEAKEATSDLNEALKVCYQPNPTPNSREVCQISVPGESSTVSTIPKQVAQMLSLLQGSSEVQVAVASLASDKSVWEAVMKNEKVIEFCKNPPPTPKSNVDSAVSVIEFCKNPPPTPKSNVDSEVSVTENEFPKESYPSRESEKTSKGSMFANVMNNFKSKVSGMISNTSDYLQDFLAISQGNSGSMGSKTTVTTAEAHTDMPLGASLFALAVATILLILLKRG